MAAKVRGLQQWCKRQCEGYRDVNITNMTSSWKNGLAFCAIIHRYRPELINYDALSKDDVFGNNKLAFDVASEQLGIPALLDAEDMLTMSVPDKLCIITYVSQYYNYFHDKTPGVSSQPMKQTDTSTNKLGVNGSSKADAHSSNGQRLLSPPEDEFLRNMSANVAHRRGSVVDDTCYKCGLRVYLLERHLASTGKLFHRHCYRDSERTATLQRANSRRPSSSSSSSCQKENLLPPSQPGVATTGRRKSSTSPGKSIAPQSALKTTAERHPTESTCERPTNMKQREADTPKMSDVVTSSEAARKKKPASVTVATKPATPTTGLEAAADAPKSMYNGSGSAIQRPLIHSPKQPEIISPGTARFTRELAKVPNQKMTTTAVDAKVGKSSATGSTSVVDHCGAATDAARSSEAAEMQTSETFVPTAIGRARPTPSVTRQSGGSTAKTRTEAAPPCVSSSSSSSSSASSSTTTSSTSSVSPRISSIDRSCDIISGTKPVQLIIPHSAAPSSYTTRDQIEVTSLRNDLNRKPTSTISSLLLSSSSSNDSALGSSFDSNNSMRADISFSPMSSCFSDDSAISSKSTRLKTVMESRRSEPFQSYSSDSETTRSTQHCSPADKRNGLTTNMRQLYKPRSLENLLEPSRERKADRKSEMLRDNDTEAASSVNEKGKNSRPSTEPSGDGVYSSPERLEDRETARLKSTGGSILSNTSQSRVSDEIRFYEAHQNAAKSCSEPTATGLANSTKDNQLKLHEDLVAKDKETASRVPGVPGNSRVFLRSQKLPQPAAVKKDISSPVASHSVASRSPMTVPQKASNDRTSKENKVVSPDRKSTRLNSSH